MSEETVEVGDRAKCKVTKIEGIVVVRHDYLYGCARIGIQPEGEAEGKAKALHHADIYQIDLVEKKAVSRNGLLAKGEIELGDDAEDKISGFKGVCTGRAEWLYACTKVVIQPRELNPKTRKPVDSVWFDEPQVKKCAAQAKIKLNEETTVEKRTGGFDKHDSSSSFNTQFTFSTSTESSLDE